DPVTTSPVPPPGERRPRCGNNTLSRKGANTSWYAVHVDMDSVAGALAALTRRTVLNKTGLTGVFDIEIELPPVQPAPGAELAPAEADAFTVLREQLGLVLEPGRGPVEYFVVDRVERPTEN